MTIFTKPIDEITYQDVIDFCGRSIPEGISLDYKEEFPSENEKLAKTIAAFANTWSGVVLIGVEEEDRKPKPPFKGIHYREKLYEQIDNIVIGHIRPPVLCEVQIPNNEDKSRTFVVIRVPQSNDAHVLLKDGGVYIRTGSSSHPEQVASPEQIGWLMDRRKKSVELRESILSRSEDRFSNLCSHNKINKEDLKGICSLFIIPLYPQRPLVEYQEIPGMADNVKIDSHHSQGSYPFGIDGGKPKTVQGGISHFACSKEESYFLHFCELNCFGLFMYKATVAYIQPYPNGHKRLQLDIETIISLTCLFLKVALRFYELLGYWGLLKLQLRVENVSGVCPLTYFGGILVHPERFSIPDKELPLERQFYAKELDESLENAIISVLHEVFWSLGIAKKEQEIRDIVRRLEPNIFQNLDSSLRSE